MKPQAGLRLLPDTYAASKPVPLTSLPPSPTAAMISLLGISGRGDILAKFIFRFRPKVDRDS